LSPHTDDGELAAGGTIARFVEEGFNVTYVALSAPRAELHDECARCLEVLGVCDFSIMDFPRRHFPQKRQEILQFLYDYNQENEVDLVLTPSTKDLHQDNCFVALDVKHVEKKLDALACYKTQETRHYFDREYLRGLMRSRGVQVGERFAESFEVIKLVLS